MVLGQHVRGGYPIPPPPSFLAVPLLQVLAPPPSKSQQLFLSKSQHLLPPSLSNSSSPSFASFSSPKSQHLLPPSLSTSFLLGWGLGTRLTPGRPGSHLVSCPDPTLSRSHVSRREARAGGARDYTSRV